LIPGKAHAAFTRQAADVSLQEPSSRFWRLLRKAPLCKAIVSRNRNKGNCTVTATLDGEIRDGRHQMQVRVYFEDTDAGQIVYHANFLRFMERGRTNYLRLLGTNQHALLQEARNDAPGFTFVVRSMTIDFLKPAVLDDVLDAVTIPQEVRGASIALLQQCRRADDILITAVYAWHLSQAEKRSASRRRCGLLWKGIDQPTPHSRLSRPATQ
jgi:acyl-CoA thioester hydrolase